MTEKNREMDMLLEEAKNETNETNGAEEQAKPREREVIYQIREHLGVLSAHTNGWKKELNMVSWNGTKEKFDLREWDETHRSMSRGITLNKEEMRNLKELIADLEL